MNKIVIAFLSLLSILGSISPGNSQQYAFKTYTTSDGLPQSQIFAIHQDKSGYLWIGTFAGACRYDGNNFQIFDRLNGLADNHVLAIQEDKFGRIWIGTLNGGMSCYDPDISKKSIAFSLTTDNSKLPHNRVNAFYIAINGDLWVATNAGICQIQFNKKSQMEFQVFNKSNGLGNERVNTIFEDRSGRIWVGTLGGGLAMLDLKKRQFRGIAELSDSRIASSTPDWSGGRWVALYNGNFLHFDVDSAGRETIRAFKLDDWGIGDRVNAIWHSDNNIVWFATFDHGLVSLQLSDSLTLSKPKIYSTRQGLAINQVRSLWQDHENTLWIGTNGGGLCKFRGLMFANFTTASGLSQNIISALFEDSDQNIWIGTHDEGLCRFDGQAFQYFNEKNGLPSNQVRVIHEDDRERLWIGTRNGLCYYNGSKFVSGIDLGILGNVGVISACPMKDGSIWFGTNGQGIYVFKNGSVENLTVQNAGLLSNYARTILEAKNGDIWIGSGSGLSRYDGSEFRHYTRQDGLHIDQVSMLIEDSQDRIWIATDGGNGIRYYDGDKFHELSTNSGLSHNIVYSLIEDNQGNIWFDTNKGLDKFDGTTFRNFNIEDGLVNDQGFVRTAIMDHEGRLWFGTVGGVAIVDPEEEISNLVPPPVYITEIRIHDKSRPLTDNLILNDKENYISFKFSGLSFANEDEVFYRYFLQGVESDWSESTWQNSTKYPYLGPGNYTFCVKASNNHGIWSETAAEYSFVILAPFWRQTWFIALLIISAAGLSYGWYYRRTLKLRRQKIELEKTVEERTEEVVLKNLEIYRRQEIIAEKTQETLLKNAELQVRQRIISEQKEKLETTNKHLEQLNELKNQLKTSFKETAQKQMIFLR